MKKIAILGCGNMTQALFRGVGLDREQWSFYTYTPSYTRAVELAEYLEGEACKSLNDLPECDFYFLGCKPQQFPELAKKISSSLATHAQFISIMAALSCAEIQKQLAVKANIMRIMPNTPALIGLGALTTYFSGQWSEDDQKSINQLFCAAGELFEVTKEQDIDVLTPLNGSGPAYIFEIARILQKEMMEQGFSQAFSHHLVKQTLYGAASLLKESPLEPEELRNQVTSKKGITEKALEVLEARDLDGILREALNSGRKRSLELAGELKQ